MDKSRNALSNIISVTFSVVLAFIFCFSIGLRFGIDNMVSRAIIAAVHCGFIVGLAFVLNKIILKILSRKRYIDYDKLFIIFISIASVLFVVLRLLVISGVLKTDFSTSTVYELTKSRETGSLFIGFSNVDELMATILSLMFKVAGDTFLSIYLIQFIFAAISYALFVISISKIFDRFTGVMAAFVLAVTPLYFNSISSDSSDGLVILLFSILLYMTAKYKNVIEQDEIKVWFSLLIAIVCGIFSIFSNMLTFFLVIPIVLIWDCRNENRSDRIINTFVLLIGCLFTVAVCLLLDSYLISQNGIEGFAYSIIDFFKYRFSYNLDFRLLNSFIKDNIFFAVLIICIVYFVMFWKHEEDSAHLASIEVIVLIYQIVAQRLNNPNAFVMTLFLMLVIIGAAGIKSLGYTADLIRVYKIDDDRKNDSNTKNDAITENNDVTKVKTSAENNDGNETNATNDNNVVNEAKTSNDIDDVIEIRTQAVIDDVIPNENDEVVENYTTSENVDTTDNITSSEVDDDAIKITSIVRDETPEINKSIENHEASIDENVTAQEADADINNISSISSDRKYSEAEVRKTTNYGINDVDFESLFTGGSVPPKSVYNDLYTQDITDEDEQISAENELADNILTVNTEEEHKDSIQETSELAEDNTEEMVEELQEDTNDMNDKKAYVDSFFGYLYNDNDSKTESEAETPKYVSNADKFADLDLDLGFDGFDNPVSEDNITEVANSADINHAEVNTDAVYTQNEDSADTNTEETDTEEVDAEEYNAEETTEVLLNDLVVNNVVEESVIAVNTTDDFSVTEENGYTDISVGEDNNVLTDTFFEETVYENDNQVISEEFGFDDKPEAVTDFIETDSVESLNENNDEDISIEEILERKIDKDFSYEEALNNRLDLEEYNEAVGFSYEDALVKKLDVEESIERAYENTTISLEESLNEKLIVEESMEEAIDNDYVSYEKTLNKMIDIEEKIDDHLESNEFSYQEAIETKIDVENAIENATNEKMLEEFGSDELFKNIDFDFSGEKFRTGYEKIIADSDNTEETADAEATDEIPSDDSNQTFVEYENLGLDKKQILEEEIKEEVKIEEEIKFIENPLPVPKKPKHREMDYGRVIPYAWMHYDVELDKSNDHYDI